MGGTVHGVVNKTFPRYAQSEDRNALHVFACIAQFFDHLCTAGGGNIMTRLASNYAGGTGFDYPGGSNPIGYVRALGLWKMNTSTLRPGGGSALGEVYILLTGHDENVGTWNIVGTGGDTSCDGEVMISMAFREDGGNPSLVEGSGGGAPNDDGLDVLPSSGPIWDAGASTVHVFPRTNNPGGSYDTNKNLLAALPGNGDYAVMNILDGYFQGFADDDNWIFFLTSDIAMQDGEPKNYQVVGFGLGDLQPNAEGEGSDPYNCYMFMRYHTAFPRGSLFGDSSGSDQDQGGVKGPNTQVIGVYFDKFAAGLTEASSPNPWSAGAVVYDEFAVQLYDNSTAWLGYAHEPGGTDFWRFIYGVPNEALDATNERAAFGPNSTLSEKITVPWPSSIGEAPGATRTEAGVTF
jgi:hypothetical protein